MIKLEKSDTLGTTVDKINDNFDELSSNDEKILQKSVTVTVDNETLKIDTNKSS